MGKQETEEVLNRALAYFKKSSYQRLFEQLYERCYSLGRLGGTVRLNNLRRDEADALEGFLQKDCHNKKSISISVEKIRKSLANTKFSSLSLEELVVGYFKGEIVSKKEMKQKSEEKQDLWFESIEQQYTGTVAGEWLYVIRTKNVAPFPAMVTEYRKNQAWMNENFHFLIEAFNRLPYWKKEYQKLPVFAARVSGNPHYFDVGKKSLTYLLYFICAISKKEYPKRMNAELRSRILYDGGILIDDLSNDVLTYGIYGVDLDGKKHSGMEDYANRREVLPLTLANLTNLKQAYASGETVYIVENPMVFAWLVDQQKDSRVQKAVICSAGQLNLSVWVLLDLLAASNTCMYYAGDFDPEGLLIAQKIASRYKEKVCLWHYTKEDYFAARSRQKIPDTSMKILNHMEDQVLVQMAELLRTERIAGYQENILVRMTIM